MQNQLIFIDTLNFSTLELSLALDAHSPNLDDK